ncbi:MAG TPA: hypothetical protein VE621_05310 [Bryobacteraceae bacterium]|nr:hypothetical protein [Bryobacteraceae bacterium]
MSSQRVFIIFILIASIAAVGCETNTTSSGVQIAEKPTGPGADILDKYLASTKAQSEQLKGKQMEVQISAQLPKLKKSGTMNALRKISDIGKVSYKMLGFSGDNTIKNDVIARYLTAETQGNADAGQFAITPNNYKFKYIGQVDENKRRAHVFKLEPKKKRVGLFKGELWIDADTYMPMREVGSLVRTPSVFLKKVEFARVYSLENGISFPDHIDSTITTRIAGPAQIEIKFSKPRPLSADEASTTNQ